LIRSKFSAFADSINAVWFWKKLVSRGGTRDKKGGEQLAYFKGGFGKLAEAMAAAIHAAGGEIRYSIFVTGIETDGKAVQSLTTSAGTFSGRQFLFTPAFPIIADIFDGHADKAWTQKLRRVRYLGNICLVLQLDRSLSDTYLLAECQ
jgi:phytoene dehydrogenase-like protein